MDGTAGKTFESEPKHPVAKRKTKQQVENEKKIQKGKHDAKVDNAKKLIEDFLVKNGFLEEINPAAKNAKKEKEMRLRSYQNVESLLRCYRVMKRTYAVFKEEYAEKIAAQMGQKHIHSNDSDEVFSRLADELQIFEATQERKFARMYEPQILSGLRIETALNSLDFAMKVLKANDEELWKLIDYVYIQGSNKPLVEDIIKYMGYLGMTKYYNRRDEAISILNQALFGMSPQKDELMDILVLIRQQNGDDSMHF